METMANGRDTSPFVLPETGHSSIRTILLALLCGALIVIIQVSCSVLISDKATIAEAYRFMGLGYDSNWYAGIMMDGYSLEKPFESIANVAFMPAYPLLSRPLYWLLRQPFLSGIVVYPPQIALLLTAQTFAVIAWMYLILLMRRFGVSPWLIGFSILAILAQPFSFIMVRGYSESLFLLSVTGLLYWLTKPVSLRNGLLSQAHAFVASAARMHGLALLLIPLSVGIMSAYHDSTWSQRFRRLFYHGTIAISALAGAVIHFSYLYWKFGDWLLYFHSQMEGWGYKGIGLLGVFRPDIYRPWWRLFVPDHREGNWIDFTGITLPVLTSLCVLLIIGSLVLAYRKRPEAFSGAVALFVYGMLYLTIVGSGRQNSIGFAVVGLSRYEYSMMFLLFPFLIIQIQAFLRKPFNLLAYGVLGCVVIPMLFYHFYVLDLAVNYNLAL